MKLSDKIRYLREIEGSLRGLDRAMTQQELVRAIAEETGGAISQSYLSQIESGARPHLTNTTRLLLAKFFKVHPGYLVEDPEDFQAELRTSEVMDAKLDLWLIAGAERFGRRDAELCRALLDIAHHPDSRKCLLLLGSILKADASAQAPALVDRLTAVLAPRPLPEPETAAATKKKSTGGKVRS
jgi:transcriptional regulator with XRE-family HTH domain